MMTPPPRRTSTHIPELLSNSRHLRNDPMPDIGTLLKIVQFTDSTLPIGAFSFSNGLESAAQEGMVHDAATLQNYVRSVVRQAATSDGIALLDCHRAAARNDYERIREADLQIHIRKLNEEARTMTIRMGRKLAELVSGFADSELMARWRQDIMTGATPGTYPVAQAILFQSQGISERELFHSHQYGIASMVLGAALRIVRVTHIDTQKILFLENEKADEDYESIASLSLDDMYNFSPMIDILAALHVKAHVRMFMN